MSPLRSTRRRAAALGALFAVFALFLVTTSAGPARAASSGGAGYTFDPTPIAAPGSLREASTVTVVVTADDAAGSPAAGAAMYLSFSSTASPGGSAAVGSTPLRSSPQMFSADRNGQVAVSYTTATPQCAPVGTGICPSGGYPTNGIDTINAANAADSPTVTGSDSYNYASAGTLSPDQYFFGPNPIASPASLTAGQKVSVTLAVLTSSGHPPSGQPEPGKQVYLSLSTTAGGGSVSVTPGVGSPPPGCVTPQLSSQPTLCTTDSDGQLQMTYTAGGSGPGQSLPAGGRDVITVQNAPSNPTETGTDAYDYGNAAYRFSPTPMAAAGTLGSSQSVSASLIATDASGKPLVGAPVYLSLGSPAAGSATATGATPSQNNPTGSNALSSTPTPFDTDANGRIVVTYHTPSSPPASGTDVITAQNAMTNPTSTATDSYSYAPAVYTFTPNPVAAPGGLAAGQSVNITLALAAPSQQPQSGGTVYLSLTGAPGGGKARVGSTALSSTPAPFATDASGRVSIVYIAPSPLPRSGTDTITAQDAPSSPTDTAADTYTFSGAGGAGGQGYWLVARDGGIFTFGSAPFYGSRGGSPLNAPITSMTATPDGHGYWFVGSDGGIFTYGDAGFYGSMGGKPLAQPVVGMATTPDGAGYWLVAADGGIFNFGDAHFYGAAASDPSASATTIVGMAATPDGNGYWEVGANGAVFAFGDAHGYGGANGTKLNAPIVAMAPTATGDGYWLVGSDGGVFTYGDAFFYGSTGNIHLVAPIDGMAATSNGAGYWFVASDGGVFSYGNAPFQGSMGGKRLNQAVVGMAGH